MPKPRPKPRTKHRATPAGVFESRGRPVRRPPAGEQRKAVREDRRNRPPTWKSAFLKAALMAGLLFAFTQLGLFGSQATIGQSVAVSLFALLLYTPLAYMTDSWVYRRAQRRRQEQSGR